MAEDNDTMRDSSADAVDDQTSDPREGLQQKLATDPTKSEAPRTATGMSAVHDPAGFDAGTLAADARVAADADPSTASAESTTATKDFEQRDGRQGGDLQPGGRVDAQDLQLIDDPAGMDAVHGTTTPDDLASAPHDLASQEYHDFGSGDVFADRGDVAYDEVGLDADVTPAAGDLEELLQGEGGYGGADGRNPASDSGGPTDPQSEFDPTTGGAVGGNPYAGAGFIDGSAAGALPEHQQAVLNMYRGQMDRAAEAGDHDRANEIAEKVHSYLVEIGQAAPAEPADGGGGGGSEPEGVGVAPGVGVGYSEGEGVQGGDAELAEEYEDTPLGEFVEKWVVGKGGDSTAQGEQLKQAVDEIDGTGSAEPAGTTPPPEQPDDAAEDKTPEQGLDGPDMWKDFTDGYQEHKFEAERGADIDYGDTVQGSPAGYTPVDPETLTGQYGQDFHEPDDAQVDQAEAHLIAEAGPEDEFLEP